MTTVQKSLGTEQVEWGLDCDSTFHKLVSSTCTWCYRAFNEMKYHISYIEATLSIPLTDPMESQEMPGTF
jgi:hypothetical protein